MPAGAIAGVAALSSLSSYRSVDWVCKKDDLSTLFQTVPRNKACLKQKTEMRKEPVYTEKYRHCGYLSKALESIEEAVTDCKKGLEGIDFDTIAFRGMSGALVAPIVARDLKKEIILVRKTGEDNHSGYSLEGHVGAKKYVILDDFVSTGRTVREIIKQVKDCTETAELVGGVFYNHGNTWMPVGDVLDRVRPGDFNG